MNNPVSVRQTSVIPLWEEEYGPLRGKKLLLLGGGSMMKEFVTRAKKMGIITYVMGLDETDSAKELCDHPVLGNAKSVNEIVDFCEREGIDGITTGYVDILLQECHDACEILGKPFFANNETIDIATNKEHFKQVCSRYGLPVPRVYYISDFSSDDQLQSLDYPVFIKPVDNSGSRGAYICEDADELRENYAKALRWSPSKTISVEECLTGQDIILDYLIQDGEPHLVSLFDRYVTDDRQPPVNSPNIQFCPSKALDAFHDQVDPCIRELCAGIGLKNGIIFFQGYYNDGKITLFEMGCRMGASFFSIEEAFIGVNPIDVLIHLALTGKMTTHGRFDQITPRYQGIGCAVYLLLREGVTRIDHIEGIDNLWSIPYVEHVNLHYDEGQKISWERTIDVRVLTVYVAVPDEVALREAVAAIYETARFTDCQGNSLLAPVYPVERICSVTL